MSNFSQRTNDFPFDLRDRRAMVSLGPLSRKKYCTYSCAFCYVQGDFLSYSFVSIKDTINWLDSNREEFDIIYISGDTDSFAPPRTQDGLNLLLALTEFDVDLMFTTRYVFSESELTLLDRVGKLVRSKGNLLFGCTSIAQLSFPHLEPNPIRPPHDRLAQLERFKSLGIVSVLAMRPFLPIVPLPEYLQLVDLAKDKVDVILGERWYADRGGILENRVFQGSTPNNIKFVEDTMNFDINNEIWKVFEGKEIEEAVRKRCSDLSIPFFMRSYPAVRWAREHSNLWI